MPTHNCASLIFCLRTVWRTRVRNVVVILLNMPKNEMFLTSTLENMLISNCKDDPEDILSSLKQKTKSDLKFFTDKTFLAILQVLVECNFKDFSRVLHSSKDISGSSFSL